MEPNFDYADFKTRGKSILRFEGNMKNNHISGKGKMFFINKSWFEGHF